MFLCPSILVIHLNIPYFFKIRNTVNLLSRYILLQFLKNIMMLVLSFIAIYLLIDFFEKIDNFMEKGKSMALVGKLAEPWPPPS